MPSVAGALTVAIVAVVLAILARWKLTDTRDFELVRIRSDAAAEELSWARTGVSPLPEQFHGIYWMDQRGVHLDDLPASVRDGYQQVCGDASDELLVSFGEVSWDAQTNCTSDVLVYGGTHGQWTYNDQGDKAGPPLSDVFDFSLFGRGKAMFCLKGPDRIELTSTNFGFSVPRWIINLGMRRTKFGWTRTTGVVESFPALQNYLGIPKECHYPVFQVIDGYGRKTKHFDAYMKWATGETQYVQTPGKPPPPVNPQRGRMHSLVARPK